LSFPQGPKDVSSARSFGGTSLLDAYNLTRVMNIMGIQPLMAAIRA
jgi:hypothetical protein